MANNSVTTNITKSNSKVEQQIETTLDKKPDTSPLATVMHNLAIIGSHVPAWWSPARDLKLSQFWKDGAYLSSIMGMAVAKLTNIPLVIRARDESITKHVAMAEEMNYLLHNSSEFGAGLFESMSKYNEDWLGTDNGGFIELLGDGKRDGPIYGPVVSVRHIDSSMCIRTGDPNFPVLVREDGTPYKLHRTRVLFSAMNPSAKRRMNGVGYCAVSRSIEVAHSLMTMLNYRNEKMGSRPKNMLLVGNNINGEDILTAFAIADQIMDSLGLRNFARIVAVGGTDVSVERVDLNVFEPFDEEVQLTLGMYSLALAWMLEPHEIFPVKGGTGASENVALQRSRGKLPETYQRQVIAPMSYKLLPREFVLTADYTDDTADHQRAVINDIHARTSSRNLKSGATTKLSERQLMFKRGSIERSDLVMMNLADGFLEDGSPIAQLFFKKTYADLLVIRRDFLVVSAAIESGNRQKAMAAIELNKALVYDALANTSGVAARRALESYYALDWLERQYLDSAPDTMDQIEMAGTVNLEDGGMVDGVTKEIA